MQKYHDEPKQYKGYLKSALAGQSTAIPKAADGVVEMMRQLKITRDTAVKARTTAMNTLKQIIVHAPPVLREALHDLTDHGLLTRCAGLRPGPIDTPTASAKHTAPGACPPLDRSLRGNCDTRPAPRAPHDRDSTDPPRGLRCGRPHRGRAVDHLRR